MERGIPLETRVDLQASAERAARQLQLAADPDQGGKVSHSSLQEAHVILALDEDCQTLLAGYELRYSVADGLAVSPADGARHDDAGGSW